MEPVVLRTERLVLRAIGAEDVDAITTACQDPEIPRWTTVPSPYSREDAEGFVELTAKWWDEGSETVWGVFRDDVLVGVVGLHRITPHPHGGVAEIGYWATAGTRGRGFTVEAARAAIDWAFAELELARITWRAVVGNIPSARTARALGFRYEGLARQGLTHAHGRYDGWMGGLLASDERAPVAWPIDLG
ncbi:RimJ/RimL family protein N-acetyltransferase [Microbacterium ginsengiterrae]|uniref:RimJ/RimL family protein N-acetyltransferase n=1 Tax=Microbacterium ginsengiterrae TaxID=546115 RepID=A0A7W9CDM0_9MICO|nr:GNAT family protein [Microbacterium ginsengiterrae]MBB5743571.1 RimJ/RimL family protein N-acetyltransferase [Microbacterium ginsengiterrae]